MLTFKKKVLNLFATTPLKRPELEMRRSISVLVRALSGS